jgi:hypothetical protein
MSSLPSVPSARTEVLLAAMLCGLAVAVLALFPAALPLAVPLLAIPAVRVAHRLGAPAALVVAVAGALAAAGLGASAAGPFGALTVGALAFLAIALPCAAAAWIRRGADPSAALLALAVAGVVGVAAAALLPPGRYAEVTAEVARLFDQSLTPGTLEKYRAAGMKESEVEQARRVLELLRAFFVGAWPGFLSGVWVLGAAVATYAGARTARPAPSAEITRFERLQLPAACALLFVLAGAAAALRPGPARLVAGNLLPPLAALYFLAGLSIICGFARRWFRVAALRAGLYLLASYPPMCLAVTLLGLFDWYADFRKIGEGASKAS